MVTKGTYYKALLLVVVFGLNTVVSFACSFSNLFHQLHHHNSPATREHHHKGNKKHEHEHSGNHHDSSGQKEEENKDCCFDSAILQKLEKSVSRSIEAPSAVFTTSFISLFPDLEILQQDRESSRTDKFRWRPLETIPDLRIVIQSFQI